LHSDRPTRYTQGCHYRSTDATKYATFPRLIGRQIDSTTILVGGMTIFADRTY